MLTSIVITMIAGAGAGCLGALLGIGGGVFLVPVLNLAMGLPFKTASGISLITIVATSSVTSASKGRLHLANLRLGMVLEVFTTSGGLAGVLFLNHASEPTLRLALAWTCAAIAVITLTRLHRRNVILDPSIDVGRLGGRYHERESGGVVAYRVKRLPLAFGGSFAAGVVSALGIGGGVVKVPVLNVWCGVPLRPAAATSALMIGATALVGAINAFARGYIVPEFAAGAAIGVLAGSKTGAWLAAKSPVKSQKILMAVVLVTVSAIYFLSRARDASR